MWDARVRAASSCGRPKHPSGGCRVTLTSRRVARHHSLTRGGCLPCGRHILPREGLCMCWCSLLVPSGCVIMVVTCTTQRRRCPCGGGEGLTVPVWAVVSESMKTKNLAPIRFQTLYILVVLCCQGVEACRGEGGGGAECRPREASSSSCPWKACF